MADSELTPKQELFCLEYLKDVHLSNAYMRAYPDTKPASARALASKLLTNINIQTRIAELMKERSERTGVDADKVVKRLAELAFGHLGMVCIWTSTGLEIKDKSEMTDGEMALISSIDISPISDGDGGLIGYRKKVTMRDSLKALELLGKHLGMLDGSGSKGKNTESYSGRILELIERVRNKRPPGSSKPDAKG